MPPHVFVPSIGTTREYIDCGIYAFDIPTVIASNRIKSTIDLNQPVRLAMKVLTDMGLAPSVKEAGQLLSHPSLRERISLVQLESGDQGAATLYYKIEPLVVRRQHQQRQHTARCIGSISQQRR